MVENPGFRPGFRPARPGLRPAHDKLRTFRVENLVESVLDLSQHVVIDLARFRPNQQVQVEGVLVHAKVLEALGNLIVSQFRQQGGECSKFRSVPDVLLHPC